MSFPSPCPVRPAAGRHVRAMRAVGGLCLGLAATASWAGAQAHERTLPTSLRLGFESVRMPMGGRMGLASGTLLFETASGWQLGPAVYGAATGRQGGLFVLGASVQRHWPAGPGQVEAALFAGGGGGAGVPVGGGLMLRPSISWLVRTPGAQVGLTWSALRFPSGDIDSRQLGVVIGFDDRFRFADASRAFATGTSPDRSGVGADALAGTIGHYRFADRATGARRTAALIGARIGRDAASADHGLRWTLEAAAAANGGAAGYMEVLGGAAWDLAHADGGGAALGARAAIGLGGGGAVPTGGGVIGKVALEGRVRLSASYRAGIEWGRVAAADGGLRGSAVQGWVAIALEPALEPAPGADGLRRGVLRRTEWTLALQRDARAPRQDGRALALDTMGVKIARYADEHLYGTAQWHAAYAGGGGAWGLALLGLGWASAAPGNGRAWRVGVEAAVGASGGGGVAGGAAAQALAWAGVPLAPALELRAGAGALRTRSSGATTPVGELSLTWSFAQLAP